MGVDALKKYQTLRKKFRNLDLDAMGLEKGEKLAHCIDSKSFGGKYYYPEYVVSDKGRVWTLKQNKWMTPQLAKEIDNAYWCLNPKIKGITKTVYIHNLVCNYFKNDSDKIALEEFGEDGVEVHHVVAIKIPSNLKGKGNRDKKIRKCMKDSAKTNVVYQEKYTDHKNDTLIANGHGTIGEKKGIEVWSKELKEQVGFLHRSGQVGNNSFGSLYTYSRDEKGNLLKTMNFKLNMGGTLVPDSTIVLEDYIICADAEKQFLIDNKELIMAKIKENPPRSKHLNKGFKMGQITVLYGLK